MMNFETGMRLRFLKVGGALALGLMLMAGCESKQDKAIDQAKKQAAATGQAQQVVSVDKAGNTTTTTVQPPAPGQTAQAITTTTMPGTQVPPGTPPPAEGVYYQPGGTAQGQPQQGPAEPVPGGAPVVRPADVNIPAGSTLAIRINQSISVKRTPPGAHFDGEVVEPWTDETGRVILPKGTPVDGIVDESHKRGHFKGASVLELRLTSLTLNGTRYPVETRERDEEGQGQAVGGVHRRRNRAGDVDWRRGQRRDWTADRRTGRRRRGYGCGGLDRESRPGHSG